MTEMAVARNPQAPDWEGLDVAFSARIGELGQASARGFEAWLAGAQQDHAVVLKQGRLLREERSAADRRNQSGGGQKGDQKGRGRGSKGGRGAADVAPTSGCSSP